MVPCHARNLAACHGTGLKRDILGELGLIPGMFIRESKEDGWNHRYVDTDSLLWRIPPDR